jgi:hypothetical protein
MRGLIAIFGGLINLISPLSLAALGYLSIFKYVSWIYFGGVFVVWIICVLSVVFSAKKKARYGVYYEMVGGALGYVWLASIPASLWFIISAIFFDGSWWEFGYSFLVGGLCKGWLRGFMEVLQLENIRRSAL